MLSNHYPRFLTEEEIEDILKDSITYIPSATKETSEFVKEKVHKRLKEQLREIKITPLAIKDLKLEIRKYFQKSLIIPGISVGLIAAEALSHPITQMVFNSFKSSGMAKQLVTGVDKVRNLIYISKNVKNPGCKIFFKKDYTYEQLFFEKQKELVGLSVGHLTEDYSIIKPPKPEEYPWWYSYFKSQQSFLFSSIESGKILLMLRLKLKRRFLYLHRVTTQKVAKKIEESTKTLKTRSEMQEKILLCLYSPTMLGIIDIYLIQGNSIDKTFLEESTQFIFFSVFVVPNLDNIFISGIPEIKSISIERINLKVPFIDEVRIDKNKYVINLHPIRCKLSGVTPERYERILKRLDSVKSVKINGFTITVEMNDNESLSKEQESPMKIIDSIISKQEEEERNFNKTNYRSFYQTSDIYRDYYIYYIETDGSNLRAILQLPDVDTTRVYSNNNPNEMFEVFGIETTRNYLISELQNTLSMDKSYIDPRHIVLLVDFQTYLGVLTPATYTGVQKQPIGVLSKATFEKPFDVFKRKAPFGLEEEVKSISAAVALGSIPPVGTGKIKVEPIENLQNIRVEKALERIGSIPCEKEENKISLEIENKQGIIERKEIEFKESDFKKIGAEIEKEISRVKSGKTTDLASELLEFLKENEI
jgi:DNA-directed RNA polymerase beta' subunit